MMENRKFQLAASAERSAPEVVPKSTLCGRVEPKRFNAHQGGQAGKHRSWRPLRSTYVSRWRDQARFASTGPHSVAYSSHSYPSTLALLARQMSSASSRQLLIRLEPTKM